MVDRRLIGILAITVIASTALVVLIFGERVEDSVSILRDSWEITPSKGIQVIPFTESRIPYVLTLVGRRDIADLTLRFGVLRNRSLELEEMSGSIQDVAMQVPEIAKLESTAYEIGQLLGVVHAEHTGEVIIRGNHFDLLLLDYSSYLLPEAPPEDLVALPTIFALLFDSNGNLSQYYVGSWDFFENRKGVVQELTVQLNENSTRYATEQLAAPGVRPLGDLDPNLGAISFRDLKKDDRVFYTMTVNGAELGGEEALMQVALIRVDGAYEPPIVHFLAR